MPTNTELWESWIDRRIGSKTKSLLAGIGDVMAEERGERLQAVRDLQRENEILDAHIETLQKQVRELTERLAKLETAGERSVPLRAVG